MRKKNKVERSQVNELLQPYWDEYPVFRYIDCGDGWLDLVVQAHQYCLGINPQYRIVQIKEKFGGLRYYVSGLPEDAYSGLNSILAASQTTCEECGQPGQTVGQGWVRTLCDEHSLD